VQRKGSNGKTVQMDGCKSRLIPPAFMTLLAAGLGPILGSVDALATGSVPPAGRAALVLPCRVGVGLKRSKP
jgi:hypothetical protein